MLRLDVDVIEEIALHEMVVTLRMGCRQAQIFVEIERDNVPKVDSTLLVELHHLAIRPERRASRSKAENKIRHTVNGLRDNARGPLAQLLVIGGDENQHAG